MSVPGNKDGLLVRLQSSVANFLANDIDSGARAYFTEGTPAIAVLGEYRGSVQDALNKAAAKTGMSAVVKAFSAEKALNTQPGRLGYTRMAFGVIAGCLTTAPNTLRAASVAEKVAWVLRKFSFEGKIPLHLGIDALPTQADMPETELYVAAFEFTDVINSLEPMRADGPPPSPNYEMIDDKP